MHPNPHRFAVLGHLEFLDLLKICLVELKILEMQKLLFRHKLLWGFNWQD